MMKIMVKKEMGQITTALTLLRLYLTKVIKTLFLVKEK